MERRLSALGLAASLAATACNQYPIHQSNSGLATLCLNNAQKATPVRNAYNPFEGRDPRGERVFQRSNEFVASELDQVRDGVKQFISVLVVDTDNISAAATPEELSNRFVAVGFTDDLAAREGVFEADIADTKNNPDAFFNGRAQAAVEALGLYPYGPEETKQEAQQHNGEMWITFQDRPDLYLYMLFDLERNCSSIVPVVEAGHNYSNAFGFFN